MLDPPTFTTITLAVEGGRADLTLTRPDKRNPLSPATLAEIEAAADWLDERDDVKVVVVSGLGASFSAGADLTAFSGRPQGAAGRREADTGRRMAEALERMQPVAVARIHGHCVGGGLVLAAACDLRIAAEDTYFSIPEVDLGIPLAWGGIPRLVREIGPALTKELVMTCRPFTAAEAQAAGFLNRVVPAADVDNTVDELAEAIAAKSPLAITATKRHTNAVTAQMVGTDRSWSDADGLLAGLSDPEGRALGEAYIRAVRSR